jgi:flagellar biosynthesis/type III secretory pathway M-ring protein FliF/YscJ
MDTVVAINLKDLLVATLTFAAAVSVCFVVLFTGMDGLQARLTAKREAKAQRREEEEELRREIRARRNGGKPSKRKVIDGDEEPEMQEREYRERK